ncbi:hypothetical protein AYI68_g464 [Smittium mucronatum]|uniref:Uncharacterized protein n=1 Tax=Smittium mucronatum TaxID=133383 RepID=A0A1R0H8B7_9FUNG|nr:hypothetical protein AYI68_g464 [Smittium mucronatum]
MSNHILVNSGANPYLFFPYVDSWLEVAENRDCDASVSISPKIPVIGYEIDLSVTWQENHSCPKSSVRISPIIPTMDSIQTLSVVRTESNGRNLDRWSTVGILSLRSPIGDGD